MDRWQCEILDPKEVDKEELLGFLQEEYGPTGPAQADYVGPGTQERHILRQQGFVTLPHALQPQPVLVSFRKHVDTLPMSIIVDIRNWHLTLGDFDIV